MNKTNRVKKTTLNIVTNVTLYILQSILSFIVRIFFLKKIGVEILGVNSVILNIVTMLSMIESGFNIAISFRLYEPLVNNDIKKINLYMVFFKKIYRRIGFIILFIGIIISFFLKELVGDYNNIYLIYYLYLFNTVSLYFLSYKDTLLIADQKNYLLFKYNCFFTILSYILQLIILLFIPNNIIYIIIFIVCRLLNRIINNIFISKHYNNINFNSKKELNKKEKKEIKNSVINIVYFKIGNYLINCTDSILICYIINATYAGIYSNYMVVITMLSAIIKKIYNSITSSFGNLIVYKQHNTELNVFKIMYFLNYLISGYISLALLNFINKFVYLWVGNYILNYHIVVLICINFYLTTNQYPLDTIKEANGFYDKDKYISLIMAISNIILSFVLGQKYGIIGIVSATSISYLITIFWNKPYIIYKNIFKTSCKHYFYDQFRFFIILLLMYVLTNFIFNIINFKTNILSLILEGIIYSIIYLIIMCVIYRKKDEFNYLKVTLLNLIKYKKNKQ